LYYLVLIYPNDIGDNNAFVIDEVNYVLGDIIELPISGVEFPISGGS